MFHTFRRNMTPVSLACAHVGRTRQLVQRNHLLSSGGSQLNRWIVSQTLARFTTSTSSSSMGIQFKPPMPRVMPRVDQPSTSQLSTASGLSRIKEWWDSGTILITFGWVGLSVLAIDLFLQYQGGQEPRQSAEEAKERLRRERLRKKRQLRQEWRDKPALYQAVITEETRIGGWYGFGDHVHKHDKVDVLSENVGPHQHYHLCRFVQPSRKRVKTTPSATSKEEVVMIGWYPSAYLERVPEEQSVGFWRRVLSFIGL